MAVGASEPESTRLRAEPHKFKIISKKCFQIWVEKIKFCENSYRRSGCGGRAERARLFDSKCQKNVFKFGYQNEKYLILIFCQNWKILTDGGRRRLPRRWVRQHSFCDFLFFCKNKKERYGRWFWKIANWFWEGDWGMSSRHKYRKCCGVFWFGKLRRPNLKTNGGGCNWGPWIEKFLPMEGGVDFLVVECDNRGILMMRGISRNLAGESNPRLPLKPMLFFVSLSWRINRLQGI